MKNQNSISGLQSRSEQSGANKQDGVIRHCANRRLSTEKVLNYLRTRLPQQYGLAEVVGKWVWLDVSPARKPGLANLLWRLGFHWNQRRGVWQHPCGCLTRSARIPPTRAPSIAPIFPLTFSPFKAVKIQRLHRYLWITVSETVSESGKRAVKNCDELKRILLESPIKSAIFE
jgi:hypothetical protein